MTPQGVSSTDACMKAVKLFAVRQLETVVVSIPKPAAGEVLIKVGATGVCGSDLSTYLGLHPYKRPPAVLGHEFAGVVVQVGAEVKDVDIGDRVCAAAFSGCGACLACRQKKPQLCRHKTTFSTDGWMGSFAEFVIAKQNMLYRVPEHVTFTAAALVEPLSIGVHAVRLAGDLANKSVTIIGAGNIGLCCAVAARQLGAARITCIDQNAEKETLAKECGADAFITATADRSHLSITKSGADITIVACDYQTALEDAIALSLPGGRIVIVSYSSRATTVDMNQLVRAELCISGSALADPSDFQTVIEWIADGRLDPLFLVTHQMPLSSAGDALSLMERGLGCIGKIMLSPSA